MFWVLFWGDIDRQIKMLHFVVLLDIYLILTVKLRHFINLRQRGDSLFHIVICPSTTIYHLWNLKGSISLFQIFHFDCYWKAESPPRQKRNAQFLVQLHDSLSGWGSLNTQPLEICAALPSEREQSYLTSCVRYCSSYRI